MLDQITLETIKGFMEERIPFNRFLGLRVGMIQEGFVRLELPYRQEFIGDPYRPAIHGGVISMMLDTCGGCAVYLAVAPRSRVATVDLRVDFLRPGPLDDLACEARVVRIGNRVGVTDMRLFAIANPERTIASGKGVYNISRSEPEED